jgi:hypothetical protein
MNPPSKAPLSRREWLERISMPAAAAALGAGILASRVAGATTSPTPADPTTLGAKVYNIREFGAKGDGTTVDTAAVQAAIDACNRDQGGTVLVPAGDFVTGTLELKSNITLHIAALGRLLGSPDPKDYHAGKDIPSGNGNVVLLGAANLENVTIEGNGTIDGNGLKFWTGQGDNTGPGQGGAGGYFNRPHLIVFHQCKNVRMRDVSLIASAYHCTRVLRCERVWFDGVRIFNRVNKNNDGFHINSSQYVHITNCDVKCQDDACALFGSNKWVTITGCTFSTRWSIFRFGGGEAEYITISNCVIYDTFGSAIKMSGSGRSRFENILFSNLVMHNVTGPITIGLQRGRRGGQNAAAKAAATDPSKAPPRDNPPPANLGVVRNISFNHIRAYVAANGQQYADMHWEQGYRDGEKFTCITLNGVGEAMLENISFADVHVVYEGGATEKEAAIREAPQIAGEYFEMGIRPAYGLYARNVRGLSLQNIRFEVKNPDLRPAVVFDHVSDAVVDTLSAQGNPSAESVWRVVDSQDVLINSPRVLTPAAVFLRLEGSKSEMVVIDGGQISRAAKPLEIAAGADEKAVRLRG